MSEEAAMIRRLLVPISSDPLKVGACTSTVFLSKAACLADAAVIRPKHLRRGSRTFEGFKAVCMPFDPKDAVGHEKAWLRPDATDTPHFAICRGDRASPGSSAPRAALA